MSEHAHDKPHLPHGSIWPFLMGNAIAILGLSLLVVGRNLRLSKSDLLEQVARANISGALVFAVIALGFLFLVLGGWIREDIRWWKSNTGTGLGMAKAGTLLFISSEIFIFGALFTTYFTFQKMSTHWPDMHHWPFQDLSKVLIFTVFLFASSATIHKAEKHLRAGEKQQFEQWWLITIILGAIFLAGQVWEYYELIHEGATLGSSQYMTSFFMLTGTHGIHVFGGLIGLIIAYVRSKKGNFDEHRHAYPESIAMYWHFVDMIWVIVLSVLYLIPKFALGA
jgi:cytochrome c oxidase subunit 3